MVLTHMTASAGSRTCLDIEDQKRLQSSSDANLRIDDSPSLVVKQFD